MPLPERQENILRILELRERVTVAELTDRLGVSEVTVRKDLSLLEEGGFLERTRGGARVAQDRRFVQPIERRLVSRLEAKRAVAAAAAGMVREGETLFIDSGSTCLEFARAIRSMDVRVVTNSLDVLNELAPVDRIAVHAVGGSFRRDARSFIGPTAAEALRRYHIDRAVLGTSGVTADGAFSSQNSIETGTKRQAIAQSDRVVVIADASKIGVSAFSIFAQPADVHVLVTEACTAAQALAAAAPFEVVQVRGRQEPVGEPE